MAIGAKTKQFGASLKNLEKKKKKKGQRVGAAVPATHCQYSSSSVPRCWEAKAVTLDIGIFANSACFEP